MRPVILHSQIQGIAQKTDNKGSEGFIIIFDHAITGMGANTPHLQWNIGGWTNSCHTIEGFSNKAIGNGYGATDSNGDGIDDIKAYPSKSDGKDDNNQKLVTVDVTYNIEITVENNIATCTCTPNKVGEYYMEYVFDMSTGKRISCRTVKMENTYEYYITDTNIGKTERYKHVRINGAAQTDVIDVIKMNDAYAYRSDGGSVIITPYDGNSITLNHGEHMGGSNQYITLKISYPMEVHYKWTPRANDRFLSIYNGSDNITSHADATSVAGTIYEVTQQLSPGEYTVKSGNGETVLWYLKLTPYIPSN